MPPNIPILYTFRRCPYAIRARFALCLLSINVVLREVDLKNKPSSLLMYSPKGTVPVLVLPSGEVIDQSLAIISWAHRQVVSNYTWDPTHPMIHTIDERLISWLMRYKYHQRYPEHAQAYYREQCLKELEALTLLLAHNDYILGEELSLIDVAVLGHLRQFASVDSVWFKQCGSLAGLHRWLQRLLILPAFVQCMVRYPPWQPQQKPSYLLSDAPLS